MIIEESGNLFDSHYQTFGVTVNAFGVMGAGIALECRDRFGEVYVKYSGACARRHFATDQLLIAPITSATYWDNQKKQVLCILTKYHWSQPSTIAMVEASLKAIREQYVALGIESLAIPLLGCGKGKLKPERVQPLIEAYLDPLPIRVGLFTNLT
jgi:O-acetyl-ADP-ribose deacetylase (regulator of RNase III)